MFMSFGAIGFKVLSVLGETVSEGWNYTEHKRIDGKPILHFQGGELRSISLQIRFERSFADPDQQLAALRRVAGKHQAHELVYGYGGTEGHFVITGLQRNIRKADPDGRARLVDATVTFKEDAYDEAGKPRPVATTKAQGIKRNRATPPAGKADTVTPDQIARR